VVAPRPPGIELVSILQVVGGGHSPHDAGGQGDCGRFSVLAATEEHWPEASVGTRSNDRFPRSPTVQFHVPAAPGAPGAAPGVLRSGTRTSPHGSEQEEPLSTVDAHLAAVPRLRRGLAASTLGCRGHGRHRLQWPQAAMEGSGSRTESNAGLGQDARGHRGRFVHGAIVLVNELERPREPDVRGGLGSSAEERLSETFSGRLRIPWRNLPGSGQAAWSDAAPWHQEER